MVLRRRNKINLFLKLSNSQLLKTMMKMLGRDGKMS
jgi:hypothetical protein